LGINALEQIVGVGTFQGFLYTGGSFTPIAVPGAALSVATGINNAGQIAGYFFGAGTNGGQHGFLDTGGSFTQIDVPDSIFTDVFGINDLGQIVGTFCAGVSTTAMCSFDNSTVHGFLADPVPEPTTLPFLPVASLSSGVQRTTPQGSPCFTAYCRMTARHRLRTG
jgi:uncharacterized membrane protein